MTELIEKKLKENFSDSILDVIYFRGEQTFIVDKSKIVGILTFLRDDSELSFNFLIDLCGADRAKRKDRFEVVYQLFSLKNKVQLRIKCRVDEKYLNIDSVSDVFGTANWHERETYDMYGIIFNNHPDLRRMYMPEDYEYYPLRKDFPLLGIPGSIPLPKNK
ncbi:MAG: NADH-quinone oxidoreductase subunit C [Ignavibacteria bacterium]|nr:NADH-quinone oxidoreductase subunit C [Ignavibacteria bacterium]